MECRGTQHVWRTVDGILPVGNKCKCTKVILLPDAIQKYNGISIGQTLVEGAIIEGIKVLDPRDAEGITL